MSVSRTNETSRRKPQLLRPDFSGTVSFFFFSTGQFPTSSLSPLFNRGTRYLRFSCKNKMQGGISQGARSLRNARRRNQQRQHVLIPPSSFSNISITRYRFSEQPAATRWPVPRLRSAANCCEFIPIDRGRCVDRPSSTIASLTQSRRGRRTFTPYS